MAISKEKLREMLENSRRGAAKQHAKEQAALDKYMFRGNTEVAKMMSAKERNEAIKKAFNEEGKSVEQIAEAFEVTAARVCKILGVSEQPSGMIDAAELTTEQREELTAQAEADAGIIPERTENARERTENAADKPDICDVAKNIMDAMRKVMDIPGFDVMLNVNDYGTIEVTVIDKSEKENNITLSGRL